VRNVFAISVNCHTVPFFLKQIQQSKKEFSDTLLGEEPFSSGTIEHKAMHYVCESGNRREPLGCWRICWGSSPLTRTYGFSVAKPRPS
jgi:hypothetical protein